MPETPIYIPVSRWIHRRFKSAVPIVTDGNQEQAADCLLTEAMDARNIPRPDNSKPTPKKSQPKKK